MKTLTVRLPETVVAEIEAESRRRKLSKSDVVRERLAGCGEVGPPSSSLAGGNRGRRSARSIGFRADLSARSKKYLKSTGYGDKRAR